MPQADPEVGATLQKPSTQCLHQPFQLEVEGAKVGQQKKYHEPCKLQNQIVKYRDAATKRTRRGEILLMMGEVDKK